jgi:hypothetical protein
MMRCCLDDAVRVSAIYDEWFGTTSSLLRCARLAILLAVLVPAVPACGGDTPMATAIPGQRHRTNVANLRAFARLYGVVRWFHPSDAAAAADWDQFAIEGVRRVIDVPDARTLGAVLAKLFAPVAPTVHLTTSGEQMPAEPTLHPASTTGLDLVAWEHKGFGDSTRVSEYASKRRHRDRIAPAPGALFASLSQAVDAAAFHGMRVRLRGNLRVANRGRGQLWLRVDRTTGKGFFDNMQGHPVVSTTWEPAEIVGDVSADATRIVFGVLMSGNGTAWYDDIELAVQTPEGGWKPIEIRDPGFESMDLVENWSPGTMQGQAASVDGWSTVLDRANPRSGLHSLRIQRATTSTSDELFGDAPQPGETVDIELGDGLRARVPLVLYSRNGHTLGDHSSSAPGAGATSTTAKRGEFDVIAGIADVIVAWNVLEHFWPYWDVVAVDWNAELDTALSEAVNDRTVSQHVATLQRMTAAAPDAHMRTTCSTVRPPEDSPFTVEVIEDKIVVTATAVKELLRGDVITSIDGQPAMAHLHADEALVSGSPQWRRVQASTRFCAGATGSRLTLGVIRGGTAFEATVLRNASAPDAFSHPPIDRLDDGSYYIDLSRASSAEIGAIWNALATAPGVVFDMRRYPKSNREVLFHLLTRPDDSKAWLAIPRIIRPDHTPRSISSWETLGWELPVAQPHVSGRVAFVTGPAAVSYAESLMSFVEYYHLGAIVGSPTAGTNGDVAEVTEPSGCRTTFSGLRVTKHDGSRLHLIGIQPTIPASRTIAGVIAGRDEVLERALAYVRDSSK